MAKKVYEMNFTYEEGKKNLKMKIPHAKDDLTLEKVQTGVQEAIDKQMFMVDGSPVESLKNVLVIETTELN